MSELRDYLLQVTDFFKPPMMPIERFVLAMGRPWQAAPLPAGIKRGQMKMCFKNATDLVYSRPELNLTYAEGFALRPGLIPMHHAWCVDDQDRVVDPTWDEPEVCEYVGVDIDKTMLLTELLRTRRYGVLDSGRGPNTELMERIAVERDAEWRPMT